MAAQQMPSDASLHQWFQAVDTDRGGQISVQELQKALAMGNLNFSLATVAQMIRLHDKNQSGSIGFDEFKSLHMFLTNMRASFTYFDTDRSGSLDLKEIHQAVTRAGFQLDEHAFYAACKAFDPDRDANLGEAEFIGLTLFLQSCKGVFGTFDPQNTGSATFNYSQFVYAAANTR